VFFYLAGQTAVPSLVARGRIVQANSWVQAAAAASGLLGLPVAGILIADIGPGRALAVDGITFVVSAISLAAVRRSFAHPVPLPAPRRRQPHSIFGALGDVLRATLTGVGIIWRTPVLRGATLLSIGLNLLLSLGSAAGLFRLKHDLSFSAMLIGFIFAGASAGAVALALAAGPLRRRLGFARALLLAVAIQAPLALGIGWVTNSVALGVCYAFSSGAGSLFSVTTISLRQTITPGALLGRVSAAVQTASALAITLGTFLGGLLTVALGASLTFTVMAGGLVLLVALAILGGVQRLDPRGPAAEPYWSM
jgi:hypothetical protein